MKYIEPEILAQSVLLLSHCKPNDKPGGRPCNPPRPGGGPGGRYDNGK